MCCMRLAGYGAQRTTLSGYIFATMHVLTIGKKLVKQQCLPPIAAEIVSLKPNSITLAGSELARSWFEAGSKPNSITLSVSNQLRTSFEPDPNRL